jgi:hypothetical protein
VPTLSLRCTKHKNEANDPTLPEIHVGAFQHEKRKGCKDDIGQSRDATMSVADSNDLRWSYALVGYLSYEENPGVGWISTLKDGEEKISDAH